MEALKVILDFFKDFSLFFGLGLAEIFEKIIGNVQFLAEEPITETGRQFIRNVNAVGIVGSQPFKCFIGWLVSIVVNYNLEEKVDALRIKIQNYYATQVTQLKECKDIIIVNACGQRRAELLIKLLESVGCLKLGETFCNESRKINKEVVEKIQTILDGTRLNVIRKDKWHIEQLSHAAYAADAIICHNIWMGGEMDTELYQAYGLSPLLYLKHGENKLSIQKYPLQFMLCLLDTIEPAKRFAKKIK